MANDIPHELQDRLNKLPEFSRTAAHMQVHIFEAEMTANTAADEPDAPPIRIINTVDDEPTPPIEFYYSNKMWHGPDVPKPDYDALQGCGCRGPCKPNSKTCSCIKRQQALIENAPDGVPPQYTKFLYKDGRLIPGAEDYPIVECNMFCGCSEDCPNRVSYGFGCRVCYLLIGYSQVVQHGRKHEICIKKTPNKGWGNTYILMCQIICSVFTGVFAGPKKIPAYTYLGVYAGEYITDADAEVRGK